MSTKTVHRRMLVSAAAGALVFTAGCETVTNAASVVSADVSSLGSKNEAIIATAEPVDFTAAAIDETKGIDAQSVGAFKENIIDLPNVERELEGLLSPLLAEWPHPIPEGTPTVRVQVGQNYNAVAFQDGTLVIELGTLANVTGETLVEFSNELLYATSDEELMFLLGHEFAHYALGHHSKSGVMDGVMNNIGMATNIYSAVALAQQVRLQETGYGDNQSTELVVEDEGELKENLAKAMSLNEKAEDLQRGGWSPAWNKRQEDDADAAAYDMMAAAGYQGDVYLAVFEKIHSQATLRQQAATLLQSSLTETQSELMSADTLVSSLGGVDNAQAAGSGILGNLRDRVMRQGMDMMLAYAITTHRNQGARIGGMQDYETKLYPDFDPFDSAPLTNETLLRIREYPEFQEALRANLAYLEAGNLIETDLAAAQAKIEEALATSLGDEPIILDRAASIAIAAGQREAGIAYLQRAVEVETANPKIYIKLATELVSAGQTADARNVVVLALERGLRRDEFFPLEVRAAVVDSDADRTVALVESCREVASEVIVTRCEQEQQRLSDALLTEDQRKALGRDNGDDGFLGLFGVSGG